MLLYSPNNVIGYSNFNILTLFVFNEVQIPEVPQIILIPHIAQI